MNTDRYELVIGDCPDGHSTDCVRLRVLNERKAMVLHLDPVAVRVLAARLEATLHRTQKGWSIDVPGFEPHLKVFPSPDDWFRPLGGISHPVALENVSEVYDGSAFRTIGSSA